MFTSVFNERFRSNPLCDFRLGTVATSDHETPLTPGPPGHVHENDGEEAKDYQSLSLAFSQASAFPFPLLDVSSGARGGASLGGTVVFLCVLEILQLRVAPQAWNNASTCGPYCELFFFLMMNEQGDGEAAVCSHFCCCRPIQGVQSLMAARRGTQGPKASP